VKAYGAEFFGTFWLVLGGCGSAVLAAAFPQVGIGLHGVSLAFGLTVLTMAYAIGHISGCHLNRRFPSACGPAAAFRRTSCCSTSLRKWRARSRRARCCT
jgi:glycerol uptake facilitator-like aquaporin